MEDLIRFAMAVGEGRLLAPETVEAMFAPQLGCLTRYREDVDSSSPSTNNLEAIGFGPALEIADLFRGDGAG